MKKLAFKFINIEALEYPKECMLRWESLRKPLGLFPGSEIHSAKEEKESFHLVAVQGKEVVGCVLFHPENSEVGRVFGMAISELYQGKGFGRKLLGTLEKEMKAHRFQEIYLYAREEVVGFYEKLGYQLEPGVLDHFGQPHRVVRKYL